VTDAAGEPIDETADEPRRPFPVLGVVIACVAAVVVLGVVAFGVFVGFFVTKFEPILSKANETEITHDMTVVYQTASMIHAMTGEYPESIEEMVGATDENGHETIGLEEMPKDPWQGEYLYELRDDGPIVRCLGRDGVEGGEGDDQDYQVPDADEIDY